jgi:hypothetical protein
VELDNIINSQLLSAPSAEDRTAESEGRGQGHIQQEGESEGVGVLVNNVSISSDHPVTLEEMSGSEVDGMMYSNMHVISTALMLLLLIPLPPPPSTL